MTRRLRLQPEARDDIRSAVRRYEDQRPGLGREFLAQVEATLSEIAESPLRFPVTHRHFRRALLRRFPYGISFAATDGSTCGGTPRRSWALREPTC